MNFSEKVLASRKLAVFLVAANLAGVFFGLYYYAPQLSETSPLLWLLVIDCPLFVFLFSLILGFELLGRPLPAAVKFLASVGLIKYGLWTVAVVLLHVGFFFSRAPLIYAIILPTHVIMAAESVFVLRLFRPRLWDAAFVAVFFIICDLSDYVLFDTLPWIPQEYVPQLFAASLMASFLFPALIYRFVD